MQQPKKTEHCSGRWRCNKASKSSTRATTSDPIAKHKVLLRERGGHAVCQRWEGLCSKSSKRVTTSNPRLLFAPEAGPSRYGPHKEDRTVGLQSSDSPQGAGGGGLRESWRLNWPSPRTKSFCGRGGCVVHSGRGGGGCVRWPSSQQLALSQLWLFAPRLLPKSGPSYGPHKEDRTVGLSSPTIVLRARGRGGALRETWRLNWPSPRLNSGCLPRTTEKISAVVYIY